MIKYIFLVFLSFAAFSQPDFTNAHFEHFENRFLTAAQTLQTDLFPNPTDSFTRAYNYILTRYKNGHGRAFNWSIAPLKYAGQTVSYIMAVRISVSRLDETIIPGNSPESPYEKGRNFWWVDWNSPNFFEATYFFRSDLGFMHFTLLKPQENFDTHEKQFITSSDIRLIERNGKIFAYKPCSTGHHCTFYHEMKISNDEFLLLNPKNKVNFNFDYNNWPLITIENNGFLALDWFLKEGLQFVLEKNGTAQLGRLNFSNSDYILPGTIVSNEGQAGKNSGLMPLISFASPTIELCEQKYLGVGTIKIPTRPDLMKEYFKHSPHGAIHNFREQLNEDFQEKFGNKYIHHDAFRSNLGENGIFRGLIYLLYFYIVELNADGLPHKISMSDAFLPINSAQNGDGNYKFSQFFPMGLVSLGNNQVFVSAGYGDFYSVGLTFSLDQVTTSCRHNAMNLDMENFDYSVLAINNEGACSIGFSLLPKEKCHNKSCHKKKKQVCSGCKVAKYCSRECQTKHWLLHKTSCKNSRSAS